MFTNKFLKIGTPIVLILFAILAITQLSFATPFVIGGVILQGILGGFSGKVGPVVGAKWKSIDYMRSYVIPSNPDTPAQQAQRTKFAKAVSLARKLLPALLQPFWDPFYTNKSGFNAWISANIGVLDSNLKLVTTSPMTKGTLSSAPGISFEYTSGSGSAEFSWETTIIGNGLETDKVIAVVYDKANDNFYFDIGNSQRDSGNLVFTVPTGLSQANVIGYLSFYRGTGSELIVSDSVGDLGN